MPLHQGIDQPETRQFYDKDTQIKCDIRGETCDWDVGAVSPTYSKNETDAVTAPTMEPTWFMSDGI